MGGVGRQSQSSERGLLTRRREGILYRLPLEARANGLAGCVSADPPDPRTANASRHDLIEVATIALAEGVMAMDGRTLRRTFDRAAGNVALHIVTALACEARLA